MRIEPPYTHAEFTQREAELFMMSWWRVVAGDGSTVAYVPDRTTAQRIATALGRIGD